MKNKASEWFTFLVMATVLVIFLGSILGIWIKEFWLGWVLQ